MKYHGSGRDKGACRSSRKRMYDQITSWISSLARKRDVELVLGSVDPLKRIALGGYETIKHEWQV